MSVGLFLTGLGGFCHMAQLITCPPAANYIFNIDCVVNFSGGPTCQLECSHGDESDGNLRDGQTGTRRALHCNSRAPELEKQTM